MRAARSPPMRGMGRPPTAKIWLGRRLASSLHIGGRLVAQLLVRGYQVRALVRGASPEYSGLWPQAEIVAVDVLDADPGPLERALEGIDTAYYLLHSMSLGPKEFQAADIQAQNSSDPGCVWTGRIFRLRFTTAGQRVAARLALVFGHCVEPLTPEQQKYMSQWESGT